MLNVSRTRPMSLVRLGHTVRPLWASRGCAWLVYRRPQDVGPWTVKSFFQVIS